MIYQVLHGATWKEFITTTSTTTTMTTVTSTSTNLNEDVSHSGGGMCVGTSYVVQMLNTSSGFLHCPPLTDYFNQEDVDKKIVFWVLLLEKFQCLATLKPSRALVQVFPPAYRQNYSEANFACTDMCLDHSDICAGFM